MYIFTYTHIPNPITMEKKVLTTDYNLPFLHVFMIFIHIFLICIDWSNIIGKIFPRFKSLFRPKFVLLNSSDCHCRDDEKPIPTNDGGFDRDDSKLRGDEVEMVMERLGFSHSPKREELGESSFERLFDEEEPSLEELKESFDVFDENRDGFIEAKELQRVLRLIGLKKRTEIDDCERMIGTVDHNRDGRVDFKEFVKFMENIFC